MKYIQKIVIILLALVFTGTGHAGLLDRLLARPSTVAGVAVIGTAYYATKKNCKTIKDSETGRLILACKTSNTTKAESAADSGNGDKDPSTPTGRRGNPIDVTPGTNDRQTIGDREYSGHALDQMQGRGVPPAVVEDSIANGTSHPDKTYPESRTEHRSQDGRIVVITDVESGRVITVVTR